MANEQYKVDLDTPQPGGRQGESPRSAFTKYNDFLDAVAALTGDNEFSGANSFTGDNEFSGATLLASILLGNADTEIARAAAGQIDVDGSRVYQRNNIVGTVSQSGGVPTGSLVQYGSTPDGQFVRFADGSQLVWNSAVLLSYESGVILSQVWTYPAIFSSPPALFSFIEDSRSTGGTLNIRETTAAAYTVMTRTTNPSWASLRLARNIDQTSDFSSGDTAYLSVGAVGRWYS